MSRAWKPYEGGWASDLEMEADAILDTAARAEDKRVRDWGIHDDRRQQRVSRWEYSVEYIKEQRKDKYGIE